MNISLIISKSPKKKKKIFLNSPFAPKPDGKGGSISVGLVVGCLDAG